MTITRSVLAAIAATGLGSGVAMAQDVEFMTWSYTEDANRPFIEGFIESFEGGTVEPQGYAWGEMTRNAFLRARTNSLPDVMQIQARLLPTVAQLDGILDLNEVYGRETLEQMFPAEYLAYGKIDGQQLALPWIVGTIGMAANSVVLEEAGVTEIPTTIEEFVAALEAVQEANPNSVPYGMATINANSIVLDYLLWVWTHGGDVIVDGEAMVNSPEAVAALEFMVDLVDRRLAAPEIDRPDARRLFGQGASAFLFDAPVVQRFAIEFSGDENYGQNVIPMATPVLAEGDEPVSIQWGHVIALFGEENADPDSPAAQFIMHVLSDDQLLPYATSGGVIPSTTSGQADADFQADEYRAAWAANAGTPRRNTIASLSNGAEIATIIGEEVQAAILGQKDAQTAADDMQSRITEALANAG